MLFSVLADTFPPTNAFGNAGEESQNSWAPLSLKLNTRMEFRDPGIVLTYSGHSRFEIEQEDLPFLSFILVRIYVSPFLSLCS